MTTHRATTQFTASLVVLTLVLVGAAGLSALTSESPYSSEVGFVSYSPQGERGGAIVPASCESDYYGDCGHTPEVIPTPSIYFSPATVEEDTGGPPVYWSWSWTGYGYNPSFSYCNVDTYGSEWNGWYYQAPFSGSYDYDGMNKYGSATIQCQSYSMTTGNVVYSPRAYATLNVTPRPAVNGSCAASHFQCAAGTSANNLTGATNWTWTCQGANGGSTASCSETNPNPTVNGVCAATHFGCAAGTSVSNSSAGNTYTWSCQGANGGSAAACSEPKCPGNQVWNGTSCDTPGPDLTPRSLTPDTTTVGVSTPFVATLYNGGSVATGAFSSTVYVCAETDTSCLNNPMAYGGPQPSIWNLFAQVAHAAQSIKITLTGPAIPAQSERQHTGSHTFSSAGRFMMRLCADLPANAVNELNENNNCGDWTLVIVSPAGGNAACAATHYSCTGGTSINNVSGATTWTWSCQDTAGVTVSCSETKTGTDLPPTATLSANPGTVDQGQSATLTWNSSANATSCTGTGFSTGGARSGSVSTGALNTVGTQSYQVVCSHSGGSSAPALAQVRVLAPGATITANPARVPSGNTTTLTWSANGVQSCTVTGPSGTLASGAADGNFAFSTGSPRTVTITGQSVFTITCATNGSPVSRSVTVNVEQDFDEF